MPDGFVPRSAERLNADTRRDGRPAVWRPGVVGYAPALDWQRSRERLLRQGEASEALALLQHPPVYTLGARGERRHLLTSESELAGRGAEVVHADRGGDVTFHGPGQLVAYPILDLRSRGLGASAYVRLLEQVLIDVLGTWNLEGERVHGRPGVWVGGSKVAAIGVRIRRGISTHGLALNVDVGLGWFDAIVPCGIADAGVTSLERLLGEAAPMVEVEEALLEAFQRRLAVRGAHEPLEPSKLEAAGVS